MAYGYKKCRIAREKQTEVIPTQLATYIKSKTTLVPTPSVSKYKMF
jgi:hypothetical protein